MTREEWLTSADPVRMLHYLLHERHEAPDQAVGSHRRERPLISDRKLRLFAVALFRAVWPTTFNNPDSHAIAAAESRIIEAAESHAEGLAGVDALTGARQAWPEGLIAMFLTRPEAADAATDLVRFAFPGHNPDVRGEADPSQGALLRDIAGNPFRPYCVRWAGGPIPSLARAAYAERPGRRCETCGGKGWEYVLRGGRLPSESECGPCRGTGRIDDGLLDPEQLLVLADALEEAGCVEQELLRHLRGWAPCYYCLDNPAIDREAGEWCTYCGHERWLGPYGDFGPGPHVRGCWALDLVLGRE